MIQAVWTALVTWSLIRPYNSFRLLLSVQICLQAYLSNVWTRLCQSCKDNDKWVTLFVCFRGEVMQRRARRLKTRQSWKSKRMGVCSNKPSCVVDRQGASVKEPWKRLKGFSVWCHPGVTHTHIHTHLDEFQDGKMVYIDIFVCKPKLLCDGEQAPQLFAYASDFVW